MKNNRLLMFFHLHLEKNSSLPGGAVFSRPNILTVLSPKHKAKFLMKDTHCPSSMKASIQSNKLVHLNICNVVQQPIFLNISNLQTVESIYLRRPDGKMLFHLDDDMMAYIENQQIFDIELQAKADDSEKFDMTLSEVKKY